MFCFDIYMSTRTRHMRLHAYVKSMVRSIYLSNIHEDLYIMNIGIVLLRVPADW